MIEKSTDSAICDRHAGDDRASSDPARKGKAICFKRISRARSRCRRSTATGIHAAHGSSTVSCAASRSRMTDGSSDLVLTDRARAMDERITERMAQMEQLLRRGITEEESEGLVFRQRENSLQSGAVPRKIMPGGTEKMVKQLLKSVREFKKKTRFSRRFSLCSRSSWRYSFRLSWRSSSHKGIDAQNMSAIGK